MMSTGEMASDYCIRPISVEEHHRMGEAGKSTPLCGPGFSAPS
jgi:hypothetical protein